MLDEVDLFVIAVAMACIFAMAIWSAWRERKAEGHQGAQVSGDSAYFLAGRESTWWLTAASLFASNIGSEHFVGQAGTAAHAGMAVALYEWTAAYFLLLLGWLFAPIYLKLGLTTVPSFMELRFSRTCRLVMVTVTLLTYVMSKVGAGLYAGGVLLDVVAGMNLYAAAPAIILATGAYTLAGGLHAVLWTDLVQLFIFLSGGLAGAWLAVGRVGGVDGMFRSMAEAGRPDFRHLFRPANDRSLPGAGMVLGQTVGSIWYWCLDQEMAQRVLSSRSLPTARLGTAAAGLLKILPVLIITLPGIAARALFERCRMSDGEEFPEWCGTELDDEEGANRAYPLLVVKEFPSGLRGLMVASFLSAMMSSMAAVFNSASTVFTYDVYKALYQDPRRVREAAVAANARAVPRAGSADGAALVARTTPTFDEADDAGTHAARDSGHSSVRRRGLSTPESRQRRRASMPPARRGGVDDRGAGEEGRLPLDEAAQRQLVRVGRYTTAAMVVLAFAWLPAISSQHTQLYLLAQSCTQHLVPGLVSVVLLGVFWPRANAQGAVAALVAGAGGGLLQLGASMIGAGYCRDRTRVDDGGNVLQELNGWDWLLCLHFQYWAFILAALTALVAVVVSLRYPPPPPGRISDALARFDVVGGARRYLCGAPPAPTVTHVDPPARHAAFDLDAAWCTPNGTSGVQHGRGSTVGAGHDDGDRAGAEDARLLSGDPVDSSAVAGHGADVPALEVETPRRGWAPREHLVSPHDIDAKLHPVAMVMSCVVVTIISGLLVYWR
ncbi:unnamed protein product [Pedinophyceae sp. YPF-701]|nr:unnamed protein product [Pedinophyceae sp. YPF-701]